ncbi:MAG: CidA/LrgA family protein [Enterobacteriaceae bacterium]|jgi:holin-like protein|nr:CidA/LrgA family protein [Enterobacteriaceae bacterium]
MSFLSVLKIGWQYLRAFALLYLCLIVGNFISAHLPFSLPGSIIGLLLLFCLLAFQILPAQWVKPGCSLLMKNMTLLFLPIGVGIMDYYPQLSQQILPITLSCIVSSIIVMITVAYSSHYVHRERVIIGRSSKKQPIQPKGKEKC